MLGEGGGGYYDPIQSDPQRIVAPRCDEEEGRPCDHERRTIKDDDEDNTIIRVVVVVCCCCTTMRSGGLVVLRSSSGFSRQRPQDNTIKDNEDRRIKLLLLLRLTILLRLLLRLQFSCYCVGVVLLFVDGTHISA